MHRSGSWERLGLRLALLALGAALAVTATGCGKTAEVTAPGPVPTITPAAIEEPPPELAIVGSWFVDSKDHVEPMVVTGVNTTESDTLLLALIASDSGQGPARGGPPLDGGIANVTGGGLTWTRHVEAHLSVTGEPGITEVWSALATEPVPTFTVSVTRKNDNGANTLCDNWRGGTGPDIANGMVVIQAIVGADPADPIGATGAAGTGKKSGNLASPSVTVTTTKPGSMVLAVGSDWSEPATRKLPADQTMLHEDVSGPNGDSYWAQRLNGLVAEPRSVTLGALSPPDHDCNMVAVEVLQAR